MLQALSTLIRRYAASIMDSDPAQAIRNLNSELHIHFRPEYYKNINFDSIFRTYGRSIEDQFPYSLNDLFDHLVTRFINDGVSIRIMDKLLKTLETREHLTEDESFYVLHGLDVERRQEMEMDILLEHDPEKKKKLQGELDELVSGSQKLKGLVRKYTGGGEEKKGGTDFPSMIAAYIYKVFGYWTKEWLRTIRKENKEKEEFSGNLEHEILPEHEEIKKEKKRGWENELISDTKNYIKEHAPTGKALIYDAILENRLTKKDKKTQEELGKEIGVSQPTLVRDEEALTKLLKKYYTSRPDIMEKMGPKSLKDEETAIEVPNYVAYMSENKDEQEDLYDWLTGQFRRSGKREPSEQTLNILKAYSEGKTTAEVMEKLETKKSTTQDVKNTYFDKEYDTWYKDKVKNIRKAFSMIMSNDDFSGPEPIDYDSIGVEATEDTAETLDYDSLHEGAITRHYDKSVGEVPKGPGVENVVPGKGPEPTYKKLNPEQAKKLKEEKEIGKKRLELLEKSQDKSRAEKYRKELKEKFEQQTSPILEGPSKKGPTKEGDVLDAIDLIKEHKRYVNINVVFDSVSETTAVPEKILPKDLTSEERDEALQEHEDKHNEMLQERKKSFKWISYQASVDRELKGHHIEYTYTKTLKGEDALPDKNVLLEAPYSESLKIDGVGLAESDPVFKDLHEWVKTNVLKDGVLNKHSFPIHYHNIHNSETTPDEYSSTRNFIDKHHEIFVKDAPHKKFEKTREEFLALKKLGPSKRYPGFAEKSKRILELEEMKKTEFDPVLTKSIDDELKILRDQVAEMREKGKERSHGTLDMLRKLRETRKPKDTGLAGKEAAVAFPPAKSAEAKKFIALIDKYDAELKKKMDSKIKKEKDEVLTDKDIAERSKYAPGPNPRTWLTADKMMAVAGQLRATMDILTGGSPEKADLDAAIALFPAFLQDYRERALEWLKDYEKSDPENFKKVSEKNWVEDKAKIEKVLADSEKLLKTRYQKAPDKTPSVTGLEYGAFQQLFGYLNHLKNNFSIWGTKLKGLEVYRSNKSEEGDVRVEKNRAIHKELLEELDKRESLLKSLAEDIVTMKKYTPLTEMDAELSKLKKEEETVLKTIDDDREELMKYVSTPGSGLVDPEKAKNNIKNIEDDIARVLKVRKLWMDHETNFPGTESSKVKNKLDALNFALKSLGNRQKKLEEKLEESEKHSDPARQKQKMEEIRSNVEKWQSYHSDIVRMIEDVSAKAEAKSSDMTPAQVKDAKELYDSIQKLKQEASDLEKKLMPYSPDSPATNFINSIYGPVYYFAGLYGTLSRTITFREKYEEFGAYARTAAAVAEPTTSDHLAKLTGLKNEIASDCRDVGGLDIKDRDQIVHAMTAIKQGMKKYKEAFEEADLIKTAADDGDDEKKLKTQITDMEKDIKSETDEKKKEELGKALKELYNDLRNIKLTQFRIPESQRTEADKVISKMKDNEDSRVRNMAPEAEAELKKTINTVKNLFEKKFTDEQIKKKVKDIKARLEAELSKEKNTGKKRDIEKSLKDVYNLAQLDLKNHREALTNAAMEMFIDKWTQILTHADEGSQLKPREKPDVKEDSPIGEMVKSVIPGLFKQEKPAEEIKLPKPGKATPEAIEKDIVDTFAKLFEEGEWVAPSDISHKDLIDLYKGELMQGGGGGGGGGSSGRSRKKAIRPNPPSYAGDKVKRLAISRFLKKDSGAGVIDETLGDYLDSIKDKFDGLKEDEYMDPTLVMNGIKDALFAIYRSLISLRVSPSLNALTLRKPPPGAPAFTTTPDLYMDNLREAEILLKNFVEAFDEINYYLDTDKFTIPPASIKGLKGDKNYLPNGFVYWASFWEEKQGTPQSRKPSENMEKKPGDKGWSPMPVHLDNYAALLSTFTNGSEAEIKKIAEEIRAKGKDLSVGNLQGILEKHKVKVNPDKKINDLYTKLRLEASSREQDIKNKGELSESLEKVFNMEYIKQYNKHPTKDVHGEKKDPDSARVVKELEDFFGKTINQEEIKKEYKLKYDTDLDQDTNQGRARSFFEGAIKKYVDPAREKEFIGEYIKKHHMHPFKDVPNIPKETDPSKVQKFKEIFMKKYHVPSSSTKHEEAREAFDYLSTNIASKFIGVQLPDENDAIFS